MSRIGPDAGSFYARRTGADYAFRWACNDRDTWDALLRDVKNSLPARTGRRFDPEAREWRIPVQYGHYLKEWASQWFTPEAQSWTTHDNGWDSKTWDSEPERGASSVEGAYRALHLLPSAPPEVVTAAHRAMVRLSHPDAGGSHAAAVAVNVAMEVIREHQSGRVES